MMKLSRDLLCLLRVSQHCESRLPFHKALEPKEWVKASASLISSLDLGYSCRKVTPKNPLFSFVWALVLFEYFVDSEY